MSFTEENPLSESIFANITSLDLTERHTHTLQLLQANLVKMHQQEDRHNVKHDTNAEVT